MDHLAIPVRDQERSRRFYETYFGFGARPARRYDDGVLMLYNAAGFALALGRREEPIARPSWMHFGIGLPHRDAVLALRDRLSPDGMSWSRSGTSPNTSASSAAIRTATSSRRRGNPSGEVGASGQHLRRVASRAVRQ
jgi:catechol 2,3-dioxygenase-like lactoylglutathione lyase family enzyme